MNRGDRQTRGHGYHRFHRGESLCSGPMRRSLEAEKRKGKRRNRRQNVHQVEDQRCNVVWPMRSP